MKVVVSSSILLACGIPLASAWGTLGHDTVAYIATNFVSSATKTYFQGKLSDTTTNYLANVATWADTYRYTTAGTFSAPYHFIDANDSPPESCSVDYARDCDAEGCVISAIKNYTARVQDTDLSAANQAEAARFLIHFLGDIHQPLHDEALEVGGNDIDVTFDGVSTNLHHIWDTNIPEKLVGGYSLSDAKSWAATLTTAIKSGDYASDASGWLTGMEISDPQASALIWAKDTNAFVCSTVMPDGQMAVEGEDLGGDYYDEAVPIVKLQIAKAGYRLAAWLNLIATGEIGL